MKRIQIIPTPDIQYWTSIHYAKGETLSDLNTSRVWVKLEGGGWVNVPSSCCAELINEHPQLGKGFIHVSPPEIEPVELKTDWF